MYLQKSTQGSVTVEETEKNNNQTLRTQCCTLKNITHWLSLDDT